MEFPYGGSQLGFAPKNQAAIALSHMAEPPSRSALEMLQTLYYGKDASMSQKVGRTALASIMAYYGFGGLNNPEESVMPAIAAAAPFMTSAALGIANRLDRNRGRGGNFRL